jgi:hypothetical protein
MAAVLAFGPTALLSHRSAGALWGLRPTSAHRIEVTVAAHHRSSRDRIHVHVARRLGAEDGTQRESIPVTTVPRTLLDLAEVLSPTQLQRVFEEADRLDLVDMREIEGLLARSHGRRGLRALRATLASRRGPPPRTRSELERRFLDLCREADLPLPSPNALVAGLEVDAVWPASRLVVELDGFAYHRDRAAFERDRERDAILQLAGYRVLRFTHRRMESEPAAVIGALRGLLLRAPDA